MNYINRLKIICAALYDPQKNVEAVVKTFFHPEYVQCINGVTMSRSEYIDHGVAQRKNIIIEHIEYMHHVEKGEELFALYCPKGQTHEGLDIKAEVISYFQFQDNLVLKVHGQVRLIKGEFLDVDM